MDNTLIILEKVNSFYSDSFTQLIYLTISILAFSGVILPILVNIYQKKLFSVESDKVHKLILDDLHKMHEKDLKKMQEKYENDFRVLRELIENETSKSKTGIFFVQGSSLINQNQDVPATFSFCHSIDNAIKCHDALNLNRGISRLQNTLTRLNKDHFTNDDKLETVIKSTIQSLNTYNINQQYTDAITAVNREFKASLNRSIT
jgi:hypothetical protein